MRKVALVFVLAVFVPSLVLAWLAVRSLRDQQFVLERQQSLLYQGVTDSLARQVETLLGQQQHDFATQVEAMLAQNSARNLAATFDERLRTIWPSAKVGFLVTTSGEILAPSLEGSAEAQTFRKDNGSFLGNREVAEVYWNSGQTAKNQMLDTAAGLENSLSNRKEVPQKQISANSSYSSKGPQTRNIQPQQKAEQAGRYDAAQPVREQEFSKVAPTEAEFQQLIGEGTEGTLARFVNNRLNLLFWYRSPREPRYIFGAQIDLARLKNDLGSLIQPTDRNLSQDICVAILDDTAKPAALSRAGFQANWKHPFVATEIGEALPHWEVAAYLLNPAGLSEAARSIRLTLGLLIALLVVAIGIGSWLIVSDLNRHLTLARQKTDFVSNVSHELKTPLTSIRMFSELLAEGRVTEPAKQRSYLNIITAETARLTRLINNVLDFSRMEQSEKKYNFRDCDLVQLVRETTESYRPHLENNGFKLETDFELAPLSVRGDCDALAQVIVNLLSNAEKYSSGRKEISVQVAQRDGPLPFAQVRISDRGLGVPRGSEQKIFEKFYRAHDSLSSGIQGSGLGLTLARQIARAHGGDVVYESRDGGGSCFYLRLPVPFSITDKTS